jgi:carboxyl-terminal processing protease
MSEPLLQPTQFVRAPRSYARATAYIAGLLLVGALGYAAGSGSMKTALQMSALRMGVTHVLGVPLVEAPLDTRPLVEAIALLNAKFVPVSTSTAHLVSDQQKIAGAIAGVAASYQDPFTIFMPTQQAKAFKEQTDGAFEGIGAVLNQKDDVVLVVDTIKGMPAEAAGLKKDDRILAVDGRPSAGLPLNELVGFIKGPKGSEVTLHILKHVTGKEESVKVTRGTIVIPTVAQRVVQHTKTLVNTVQQQAAALAGLPAPTPETQKVSYRIIGLSTFAKTTMAQFTQSLQEHEAKGERELIIDLRNNPGGYMDVAMEMLSYFIPKDQPILRDRTGAAMVERSYPSYGYTVLSPRTDRRIVVLVNRNSASAAEIVAAGLQDYGLAKIVGEKSYGKGSVQDLVDIPGYGSLKYTIARWYTPKDRSINGVGIVPDILVDLQKYASSTDPFMDAAFATLEDDALWVSSIPASTTGR